MAICERLTKECDSPTCNVHGSTGDALPDAMIEAGKILPHSLIGETAIDYEKRALQALAGHLAMEAARVKADAPIAGELEGRLNLVADRLEKYSAVADPDAATIREAATTIASLQADKVRLQNRVERLQRLGGFSFEEIESLEALAALNPEQPKEGNRP